MDNSLENSINSEATEATPEPTPPPEPPLKKSRKPMSSEALQKLSLARERAAEVNKAKKQERVRLKQEREEELRATKDPILVVEQSDSDPEQLEAPPGVILVRRKRPKPVVQEKTAAQMQFEKSYINMFG